MAERNKRIAAAAMAVVAGTTSAAPVTRVPEAKPMEAVYGETVTPDALRATQAACVTKGLKDLGLNGEYIPKGLDPKDYPSVNTRKAQCYAGSDATLVAPHCVYHFTKAIDATAPADVVVRGYDGPRYVSYLNTVPSNAAVALSGHKSVEAMVQRCESSSQVPVLKPWTP